MDNDDKSKSRDPRAMLIGDVDQMTASTYHEPLHGIVDGLFGHSCRAAGGLESCAHRTQIDEAEFVLLPRCGKHEGGVRELPASP